MAITIKDVAKKAGVSPSTVSRVIAEHPRISAKTSRRVKEVMDELGYHPNMMAKSLVSRTSRTIGVILPRPAEELLLNFFFYEFMRGVMAQLTRAGYDLLMAGGNNEREELETVTRLVRGGRIDGLLLLYSRASDPVISLLRKEDVPFLLVGRSLDYDDVPSVDNDNVQAAYDATKHLISQGQRRIGFVSGPAHLAMTQDRLAGYTKALTEAGLPFKQGWVVEGEFLLESGYRAMASIMNQPEPPTALVVIDDFVAFGVLKGLTELGYRIPEDVAIVSFNNIALSELTMPPITSVDIGTYQLGYTASQMLISTIQQDPVQQRQLIPHRLVVRESSLRTFSPV
ncbi:LacI family DNA-binding transcriptional regulator [Cohnella candidum]|uniref:LacI family transcriptional regulator n=1 Tax=Cohnella candidum TaxID=2674991 RepID=A0A3G3JYG4_9BACL|nr:LacI family DNA-binding transcriptional regulator [Cohnella candidum]AYQ73284.1 LacI family transcriptional regulator [Cohnella candidum]